MRVLYFSLGDSPHDRRFLSALAGSGHDVWALRLDASQAGAPIPAGIHPVEWRGVDAPVELENALSRQGEVRALLERIRPDVVHAGPIQLVAALAAGAGARPLVSMSWGSDLLVDSRRDRRWCEATRSTLEGTDILACDNQAVAARAVELGFPAERIARFPWGVDLGYFSPGPGTDFRARLGWERAFILVCLRAWEPVYGVDVVARAFVRAAKKEPALRLLLGGAGSQGPAIRRILEEGGVLERVAFPGVLSMADLLEANRAADCYISASHSDGSSVSLMEALACGLPALVSEIPGNREWVTPGEQGWRFPDGDDARLAGLILEAARDPERLAGMRQAARRRAEEKADWKANFRVLLEAYEKAAHGRVSAREGVS